MRSGITAALAAALAIALAAGVASAATGIAFSPTNTTATAANVDFSYVLGVDILCPVTLDFALHARTSKRAGSLAGFADMAIGTGRCTEGDAGLLVGGARVTGAQGPYHVTYVSFAGTLPNITDITIQVNDVAFWFTLGSLSCLTAGAVDMRYTTTGGNPFTGLQMPPQSIPLGTGGILCASGSTLTVEAQMPVSSAVRMTLF